MKPMLLKTAIGLMGLILALVWPQPGYAQSTPITAEVDRTELSTGDTLTLTVTVVGPSGLLTPSLPPLDGMVVLDRSTSSQINIVEGETATEAVHEYSLQPTRSGSLTIGPISVEIEGQTFSTTPIALEVAQGASPTPTGESPSPIPGKVVGQDYYVEAEVDNPRPYLGEQVTYIFRFYRAKAPSGQLRYDAPALQGFWNYPETGRREYDVQAAGQRYQVIELRSVLFPTLAGSTEIGPAVLTIPEPTPKPPRELSTDPVSLEVGFLPPNAPDDFNGAVGQFDITAEIENTSGNVNEAIALTVTISGQGNLSTLPDPIWPNLAQWRMLDDGVTVDAQISGDELTGSRAYHRVLVPEAEGSFEIPPISYTYFDPIQTEYRTVATEAIQVLIGQGTEGSSGNSQPGSTVPSAADELAGDIRSIKGAPSVLRSARQPLTGIAVYWAAWGVPLLFLSAAVAWKLRARQGGDINALTRSMNVFRETRRQLDRELRKSSDPYGAAGRILTEYMEKKLNHSLNGMTYSGLAPLLEERSISPDLIERVVALLSASEEGRFAPESAHNKDSGKSLLKDTGEVISALEEEFGV